MLYNACEFSLTKLDYILTVKNSHSRWGLNIFQEKKNSEHCKIGAQSETPKPLNSSKTNLFSLKIIVVSDLAWSKMGA